MPTQATTSASKVQYVERTERILVNSDRTVPKNPARPAGCRPTFPPTRTSCVAVAAISGHLPRMRGLALDWFWRAGVELDARRGQLHERLLERRVRRRELVQPDPVLEGQVADLRRRHAEQHDRIASILAHGRSGSAGNHR